MEESHFEVFEKGRNLKYQIQDLKNLLVFIDEINKEKAQIYKLEAQAIAENHVSIRGEFRLNQENANVIFKAFLGSPTLKEFVTDRIEMLERQFKELKV